MSRRRISASPLVLVGAAVGCCVVGIGVTLLVTMGPQQAAATRAAPSLPVPTAKVVSQKLADETDVSCSYQGVQVEAKAPGSAGKYRVRVVTSVKVSEGTRLVSGMPVVSVSGRPVIAFVTSIPFYRDLSVGDKGVDVRALERGLVAAHRLTKADDVFGADTARALSAINKAAGLGADGTFRLDSAWGIPGGSKVSEVGVQVGDKVDKGTPLVTADTGAGLWNCELPDGVTPVVGDELATKDGGHKATVEKVKTGSDESDSAAMVVKAPGVASDEDLTLQVVASASKGEVLTVPVGAIFQNPSGGSQLRSGADGSPIPVEVGVVAGGWAQVTGQGLKAGDTVQLGASS